jgi:hypothetical protein
MRLVFLVCALAALCISCSSEPTARATSAEADAAAEDKDAGEPDPHGTAAHGDHTPHHGGMVYMKGDLHFEVVLQSSGAHRIYFSDAARADLPAATASDVSLTISRGPAPDEVLRAEVDESGESWLARGKPVAGADVTARVAFVVNDDPYWIDVPFIEATDAAARRSE